MKQPILYIVVPCYNEEAVLPITAPIFKNKINQLIEKELVSDKSKVMFVNDGSKDKTWEIISLLASGDKTYTGISLSRNRGHQNALLAGLMTAKESCDVTISIDCDGQDDVNAMDEMIKEYLSGSEIVYGVRNERKTDTFFKRSTAQGFYRILEKFGVETVYNHADYRLMSSKALNEFAKFKEVNLFLRGMVPLVGFKTSCVFYARTERLAGESHYPLKKMLELAWNGITSLSITPIRTVGAVGGTFAILGIIGIIASFFLKDLFTAILLIGTMVFLTGTVLIGIYVIGEYIGKVYFETKQRPRYIISEKTEE